ncbi:MAG TPA: hypothetical protein VGB09_11115 [Candidatus Binatia bacterium]
MAVTSTSPIFNVIIDSKGVTLRKIKPGRPGYSGAKKKVILRQRDAIELFQRLKAADNGLEGVFSFQFLDTAKTFAMLFLEMMEQEIEDNLDRVQTYDGTKDSSDD